jgi:hypothetical protein
MVVQATQFFSLLVSSKKHEHTLEGLLETPAFSFVLIISQRKKSEHTGIGDCFDLILSQVYNLTTKLFYKRALLSSSSSTKTTENSGIAKAGVNGGTMG